MPHPNFQLLTDFLKKVPGIIDSFGSGIYEEGYWWVKFKLDIEHPLAWHVVQEIGCVANYISITERLPTRFYPVSPAPYLNGGPKDYLSWVLENEDPEFTPALMAEWLEGRMPDPVNDVEQWSDD